MRAATPDPESVDGLGPQTYPEIRSFHEDTARAGAVEHRPGVKAALDEARARKLTASGFSETVVTTSAIANKKGNFGFHVGTHGDVLDDDAHGGRHGLGLGRVRVARASGTSRPRSSRRAPRRRRRPAPRRRSCRPARTRSSSSRAPSRTSSATSSSRSRGAPSTRGGASCPKPGGGNRIGEQVFAPSVTLRSDPFDPRLVRPALVGRRRSGRRRRRLPRLRRVRRGAAPRAFRRARRRGSRRESSRPSPSTATGPRRASSKRCRSPAASSSRADRARSTSSSRERSAACS